MIDYIGIWISILFNNYLTGGIYGIVLGYMTITLPKQLRNEIKE